MDNDPETWRWIWLIAAMAFGVGEIAIAGSFFLAPFAVAAAVAAVVAFAGGSLTLQWLLFVAVAGGLLAAMRPLARRLDATPPMLGIGSHRQLGQRVRVIASIENDKDHGFVMLGAEKWRAESVDGRSIPLGATVEVVEVRGTRVLVAQIDDGASADPTPD